MTNLSLLGGRAAAAGRRIPGSLVVSFVLIALCLVAIALTPFVSAGATAQNILDGLLPPGSPGHILGTDELGRDILLLTIAGTGSALVGPACIALGSMLIGILFGSLGAYHRGPLDFVIGRATDLLLALPVMLLAIVVAGIFGSGYWITVLLLVFLFSPSDVRIVRAGVLEQAPRPYVEAAQMLSLSRWRIMFRHILPNVLPLIITNLLLNIAIALVTLSSLSFLGLGVAPGAADWGRQISDGRSIMLDNPAAVIVPAILIIAVACSINLIGDWLGKVISQRSDR
ncbi:ABC transporter permease [Lacisediminihabitans profunda]|uniref:ABC transporter permease n=1 Tax=Lacisediminihabitans profunda TaxID=2594790 RepID=A0A5C8UNK9_9MICO|nr:ABC transporter permease [Lacisediminihabitans profunda]TXN30002.1 ABC transporter permease [Lacisediminihabitans profunda]